MKDRESLIQTIEQSVRCRYHEDSIEGQPLSDRDIRIVQDSLILLFAIFYDFLPPLCFRKLEICRLLSYIDKYGILTFTDVCKKIDQILITDECSTYDEFHARVRTIGSEATIVAAVERPLTESFFENVFSVDAPKILKKLRIMNRFMSKITLHSDAVSEKAEKKFFDNLKRIDVGNYPLPTERMKDFIAKQFSPFSPFCGIPKHGNGSVAEMRDDGYPLSEVDKYAILRTNAVDYYNLKCGLPPLSFLPASKTNRTSRLIFVPKGIDTKRTVCPEPAALQYMQQGVENAFNTQKIMSKSVSLHHPEYSTQLALEGSITREFATIDQSSASDSVRFDFVDSLFEKVPAWRKALRLCRSTQLLYKGEVIKHNMFAPMGSDLCMLVQSTVYSALIEETWCENPECKHRYQVYGDDCILDGRLAEPFMQNLSMYGFLPNLEKSFWKESCAFRESCGGHYYNGGDVYPISLSRKWEGFQDSTVSNLIDLSNTLYKVSETARLIVIRHILRRDPLVLFTENIENSSAIHTAKAFNYHLQERWNPDLQRSEFLHSEPYVKQHNCAHYGWVEEARYYKTMSLLEKFSQRSEPLRETEILSETPRADQSSRVPSWGLAY